MIATAGPSATIGVDVDAAEALVEHAAPVVLRRLHAEAEEAEAREREQRVAGGDRGA